METEVVGRKRKIVTFVIALFGALLLWMYAIGYDTELSEEVFSGIQVELFGANTNGYTIADGENFSLSVDVRASGTRSALGSVDTGDFRAYVDLSAVNEPGYATLPIHIVAPNGLTAESITTSNVTLYVDTFTSKTLNICIEKTFSSEYTVGEVTQSLYAVSVYGPASIINTAEAFSSFQLGNITVDTVNVSGDIMLRDSETKAVISNPYITMSNSTVEVTFTMYGSKTLPLELVLQGGTYLNEDILYAFSEAAVTVYGPLKELAELSALYITCDETQIEEKLIETVTLSDLLAANSVSERITAATPEAELTYSVELPKIRYQTVTVPTSRIIVYGLPEDGSVSAEALESVQVTVFGTASAIKAYDSGLMSIHVDYRNLTQLLTGEYTGKAEISTGDSHVCVDDTVYTVSVGVNELSPHA